MEDHDYYQKSPILTKRTKVISDCFTGLWVMFLILVSA